MGFVELFILAVGLSLDAFAVSICKGLSLGKIKIKHMCIAGAWFGGFQALMPALGYFLGNLFADAVSKFSHWIAFFLLVLIGLNMIKESFGKDEEKIDSKMDFKTMFLLAVATSIDAFMVGVSFSMLEVQIVFAVIFIGLTTFLFSFFGIKIGSVFGNRYEKKAQIAGGIILILIALKTLLSGLNVIPF